MPSPLNEVSRHYYIGDGILHLILRIQVDADAEEGDKAEGMVLGWYADEDAWALDDRTKYTEIELVYNYGPNGSFGGLVFYVALFLLAIFLLLAWLIL